MSTNVVCFVFFTPSDVLFLQYIRYILYLRFHFVARSAICAGVVIQTVLKYGVSHIKSPVSIPVPASIANYFSPVKEIFLIKQQKLLSFLIFLLVLNRTKAQRKKMTKPKHLVPTNCHVQWPQVFL